MLETATLFIISKHSEIGEFILGLFAASWGFWLLLPMWETFSLPVFDAFLMVASETTWGLFSLLLGILTIAAASTEIIPLRKVMVFIHIAFWIFVAVMFAFTAPENTATPVYTMIAVYAFWRYIKLIICIGLEKRLVLKDE
jgi:hypothetical protein